jgi:ribosomal-protein-serine acetyltransferase
VLLSLETEIVTPRLIMRPARPEDAVLHYEAARESMVECGRWLSWCVPQMQLADSEAWVAKCRTAWIEGEFFTFFLFDREGGQFVGNCSINEIDGMRLRGNLGYWIRMSLQGRGFATECVPTVARFGFERIGLQRLEIVAAVGNIASQRVAQKVGALREGLARNRLRIHGVQTDAHVFSLIPADARAWDERKSSAAR